MTEGNEEDAKNTITSLMVWIHTLPIQCPAMNPKNEIPFHLPSKVASQTPCFAGVFESYFRLFHQDDITILPKVQ